jgi:hypothetical protein
MFKDDYNVICAGAIISQEGELLTIHKLYSCENNCRSLYAGDVPMLYIRKTNVVIEKCNVIRRICVLHVEEFKEAKVVYHPGMLNIYCISYMRDDRNKDSPLDLNSFRLPSQAVDTNDCDFTSGNYK